MKLLKTGDIQIRIHLCLKKTETIISSTDRDIWKGPGTGFDAYVGHDLSTGRDPTRLSALMLVSGEG